LTGSAFIADAAKCPLSAGYQPRVKAEDEEGPWDVLADGVDDATAVEPRDGDTTCAGWEEVSARALPA
jgi:hypothetical protein